ncbi:SDR family NAD(P)-dependent oxidoreductase [Rhizosphaericola mali]|uniref:SDR family oxidoreductase n=1 Tax=Rhizosphaericola mali TaxID=2545455 RepID=A0A5P2FWC0_9BACT|nr:SDR family oxidoreductase [Rhizosphaericola mali]QES87187.1 SDR family oxidoreductase [Rhizosphaericola mali]
MNNNSKIKNCFITGGTRGIGKTLVERFANDNYRVFFTYANSTVKATALEQQIQEQGLIAKGFQVDSRKPEMLSQLIHSIITEFGPIDLLINNAGICEDVLDVRTLNMSDFDRNVDINLKAVFVTVQAAIMEMPDRGRIINIGSNLGDIARNGTMVLYSMTKSALQGYTRAMAHALGKRRITVNLIQPGPIKTDMNPDDNEKADYLRSFMALPEYGKTEDIASLAAYLASDAGNYITGSIITIDGGMNA